MQNPSFFNRLLNSLSFPFKDPDWLKKTAIGAGLSIAMFIVPIIPMLFVYGYSKRIMKRIIVDGKEPALPEWKDWGKLLSDGLQLWGAAILYALPILILMIGAMVLLFATTITPVFLIRSDGTWPPQASLIYAAGFLVFALLMVLVALLGWVTSLLQAPALGHLVAKDRFAAAFHFKEWWPIFKKGFGAFLIAVIVSVLFVWVITFAIQVLSLTIILIFLLPFLIAIFMFIVNIYQNVFYALAYRDTVMKMRTTDFQS